MMPGIAGGDNCDDNFNDNYNDAAGESARGGANPRGQDKVSRRPAVNLGGRLWLGSKPCKGGPLAPAFGG
jgi:hypothetical protein